MSGKKKAGYAICISVVLLVLGIVIGVCVWYTNSPFPTAVSIYKAITERDIDSIIDHIEPDTAKKIQLFLNLTGLSANELAERLIPGEYNDIEDLSESNIVSPVKLSGYMRDGDNAQISISIVNEKYGDRMITLNFKRIDKIWYLSPTLDR